MSLPLIARTIQSPDQPHPQYNRPTHANATEGRGNGEECSGLDGEWSVVVVHAMINGDYRDGTGGPSSPTNTSTGSG